MHKLVCNEDAIKCVDVYVDYLLLFHVHAVSKSSGCVKGGEDGMDIVI